MLITYILQKLDNLKEEIEYLSHQHEKTADRMFRHYTDLRTETREEIRELKKRLKLLEQSQSEKEDKTNK